MNVASSESTSPSVSSSMASSQFVDGFQIPGNFPADCFRSALSYKPRPDDLFLATYPKCGTTWAAQILILIFRQGEPLTSNMGFISAAPYLEMLGAEGAEKMPRPGAIKCHLPYHLTPQSDMAKYIYVARNPKDCCVSYFHHMKNIPTHNFHGTFDEFFENFLSGSIDFGDYFDHVLGWYAHRDDPNVLFLTYEEMKENPKENILKIASFIDDKLYGEPMRNNPQLLENVLKYSSFNYMRESINKGMEEMFTMPKEELLKSDLPAALKQIVSSAPKPPEGSEKPKANNFVRKGIIGDWRNHFSEEQSRRLNEKFAESMKGTDLITLWEKYM